MSFGNTDAAPQPKQKLLNVAPERTATNEEARPLPIFWGQQRLGITWLDNARNQRTKKITTEQQAGKDDSQTVTSGIEYRADLLAAVCIGPVQVLKKLWLNGAKAYSSTIEAGDHSDDDFELEDRGPVRIYWGTPTQSVDFDGDHPNYAWQCVLRLEQFLFGVDTTSAPSIEVELGRWPSFPWLTGGNSQMPDTSCNPIAIIADALTHPLLFGQSASLLDTQQLAVAARTLRDEGTGLSPILTRNQSMDQFLTEICSHFDGVPRWVAGKLQVQLMRNAPARSTLLNLNETSLVEPPQIDAGEWTQTSNQVRITYTRRDSDYKEAAYTWNDQGNTILTGSLRSQTLNRPWIMAEATAIRLASQAGRRASIPAITGTVKAIERIARKLRCGDFFRLRWTSPLIDLVCRVTERRMDRPQSRTVDLVWSAEPSQDGDNIDATPPNDLPAPRVPIVAQRLRILELPWPLANAGETLSVLAVAGNEASDRYTLHGSLTSADYQALATSDSFAIGGVLGELFPVGTVVDDGPGLLLDLTGAVDKDLAEVAFNEATINRTLVFVGAEIMSLRGAALISPGIYRLQGLIRGRFDTAVVAHASGDEVLILSQSQLSKVTSAMFRPGQTWNFKVQPAAGSSFVDLATIAPITRALDFTSLRPPSPRNLRLDGETGGSFFNGRTLQISYSQTTWALPDFFNWSFFPTGFDPDMASVIDIYNAGVLKRTESIPAGASYFYSAGNHNTDFPSGGAGTIRVWTVWRGYRSARYLELTFTSTTT